MTRTLCLRNRQEVRPVDLRLLRRITHHLLKTQFRLNAYELCLHLVAAAEMARINWKFLRHEGSTDVVTFDCTQKPDANQLHGEIFISLDDAVAQARQFRSTWQAELVRYVIHGLLHLRGHDDSRAPERRKMKRAENRLLRFQSASSISRRLGRTTGNSKPETRKSETPEMDERTTGILLRTRLLTETSLIVHWLTPDLGRLATVAKGARRPKSPFQGKLDLFYTVEFSFARSGRSDLHTLREAVVRDSHPQLRRDLARLQQATYCAALIEQPTEMESPIPRVFELFSGFLRHLSERETQARTVIAFELKLLTELGLKPDLERSSLTPGARMLLNKLLEADWTTVSRVTLSAAQITEARQFLHGFLIYHLGKGLPGRAAALRASSD